MFEVNTKQWKRLPAIYDHKVAENSGYPKNQYFNVCVVFTVSRKPQSVVPGGGLKSKQILNGIWRLDLDTVQWIKCIKFSMPQPLYFHSILVTVFGCMCCYDSVFSNTGYIGYQFS